MYWDKVEALRISRRVLMSLIDNLEKEKREQFAKLTTQGTAIPFADVDSIIERALPRRFGGSSVHYQLLEEEVGNQTRLTLVVSPLVGTPAFEAGILAGDRILRIDGASNQHDSDTSVCY